VKFGFIVSTIIKLKESGLFMNPTENKEPDKTVSEPNSPNMAASEDVKEIKEYTDSTVKKKKGSVLSLILTVPVLFVVGFAALLAFTLRWALSFWADLTMDEIVYHLTTPLEGTGEDIMMRFYTLALLPALAVLALVCVIIVVIRRKREKWYGRALAVIFVLSLIVVGLSTGYAWNNLKIDEYLKNQSITSSFIEENYVDPNAVTLTFPKTKRNLIYIFLESFETTFTDKANGGGFDFNCIPEMTELAQKYEDFSGTSKKLNGGHVLPGTTFTMGGMFGQSSGLPLQVGLKAQVLDNHGAMNEMYTQEHFFPGITTLGDILEAEGYHNVLFIGSEAVFGGRKLYYTEHGNYEIDDFWYAVNRNWLEGKENSWGYGDWRLFLQAKERLKELSAEDQPFNLTMLTLDTHFENGIRCKYCEIEYPGNSYADVYSCSSRQLSEFISWCQDQDWYENTTIILSGDHTTMDSDFCNGVDKEYPRKTFTCYINADVEPEDAARERSFTTMDNFPTTLAAMGVKIEGDRLGLGTNLFSSQDTLYETYGKEMDAELSRRSLFMEQASEFDPNTQAYKNAVIRYKARYGDDSSVDESVTDDSSAPGKDESVTDDSSAQSADDSTTGEKNPADTATSEVGEKTDTPYNSPFPDDMADLKEHLRGKGIAGSELIKDIMKDPWKTVSANLVSVESEEAVGSEEELIADDSIQSEENLAGVANVISAKNVDDSLASEASDDSESQTAEPAGKKDSSEAEQAQDMSTATEPAGKKDSSEAEQTQDMSTATEQADEKDSSEAEQTQDMSTAVNTASEVDSQVTSEESGSDMEEEETEEALEGSWIRSEKVSDNPLEIGPAARQMYPTMFRDPDYGFLPESKLRIDPYAAFSGNRQPKTEARITTESVKQLKDWISEWNSQATRN
jgi:phosphoglycerol transferase